ncbi:CcoQ/FixQ family Cbb3-type cytochrome c oxidase assembly chaperone [Chitinophaga pendula]|uniref:CcoQ/FixQ family Cbb3-type cytochrome c oxidase assembly chaperone n=1 Tax=Chitinophaga TaxID=79328 RepID=UPI000BB03135|nr:MULTISPECIES: CcoQ/FixQ family Cbb3-type cytochrome c oxidase assembly chaperone [Chitinophaga]ASZ14364.1 CcoQ/FixQ family Cbb3-type cytochrome c oxidase assembly chaperone [Chitinophaga sp. MD30]UCJ07986.1 CcoQ/FixQ family Cbb3-type cytochrome c oxidase assembly chaperone [Chitinophaga pendula]
MKFIKYLESISHVSIYPMASLLIFTVFFALAAWWAFKADRDMIDEISRLPLGNDAPKNSL